MAKSTRKNNGKRWGKKFIDNRDWTACDRQLVKRGEYLLELKWVASWPCELKEMNSGRVGRPYQFPPSLINSRRCGTEVHSLSGY